MKAEFCSVFEIWTTAQPTPSMFILYRSKQYLRGTFPFTWSLSPVILTESARKSPNITRTWFIYTNDVSTVMRKLYPPWECGNKKIVMSGQSFAGPSENRPVQVNSKFTTSTLPNDGVISVILKSSVLGSAKNRKGPRTNISYCPRRDFAQKAKSGWGNLVTRANIKESTYSWNIQSIQKKISICLNRGREESVGNDDVSIVCTRKYEMVRLFFKTENP